MKKLFTGKEKLIKMLYEKRGIVVRTPVTTNDYDYYDLQDDDYVQNPIVGLTTVKHIRELQRLGVILYDGCWRIPTQSCLNYKGEERFRPTDMFLSYRANNFTLK